MKVNFFTKDPTVFPPITLSLPEKTPGSGPKDARIEVRDCVDAPVAIPDKQGNFLYKPGQPQFDACQTYAVLKLGMNLYASILKRNIPFAFRGKIFIFPHDGEGINAYYNREDHGVHFLSITDPRFKHNLGTKTLNMAQCLDVGAHEEVGHLLLDGLKPHFMNFELESQAFHEAFGDISSMILALQFDQVIERLIEETGEDLTRSNVVSRLGQEAGIALEDLHQSNHTYLRDACQTMKYDWKYKNPQSIGEWVPKDEKQLGAEPHNFSRFFSGVWYEIFAKLAIAHTEGSRDIKRGIMNGRDLATHLILRAVADFSPDTTARFSSMAQGILAADRIDFQGAHQALLHDIFKNRGIAENTSESVPAIIFTKENNSPHQAQKFLDAHRKALGIDPQLPLVPAEDCPEGNPRYIYQNDQGETFLTYHVKEDHALFGSHYQEMQGVEYQVLGSLKLGFDRHGQMIHRSDDLLSTNKHAHIQTSLKRFYENDLIKLFQAGMTPSRASHFKETHNRKIPYFAYAAWNDGKMVLRRVPVFV